MRLYHEISDVDSTAKIYQMRSGWRVNLVYNYDDADEVVSSTPCETLKEAIAVALQHMYDEAVNCFGIDGQINLN
jgi:hypothetical protein